MRHAILALTLLFLALQGISAEPRWFKGNTHTHSLWSDGNDFPDMIAKYYRENAYHFLVFSDHNVLSRGERWMKLTEVNKRRATLGRSTLDKYRKAFGDDWVEVRGEGDAQEVRLKTLDELRPRFQKPGEFLFIEGEEITDRFEKREVHTNAMNLGEVIKPQHGNSLRETMRNNLLAVQEQSKRLKKPMLAHLNHPNFQWSITAEDIAHVLEEQFMEVYNGHPSINHLGDETRPGDEKIWDIANTIRLAELNAPPLYGLATDDSHHYHGGDAKPGRGWVMVQAEELSGDAIVEAMQWGNFYASTGVTLNAVTFDRASGKLSLEIAPNGDESFTTQFIGTRRGDESSAEKVGIVLASETGLNPSYTMTGEEWYVRATVISNKAHPNPSHKDQVKKAWTQPEWKR